MCGGHRVPSRGQFFEPTVLADCNHTMRVMREEIFGPIVPMMCVSSDDEAISLSNDSELGLNAYVFSKSRARARLVSERVEAGSVVVNDVLTNYATVEAPFGGHQAVRLRSRSRSRIAPRYGYRKHVSFDRLPAPARDPFWFPYTARSFHWLERGVRLFSEAALFRRASGIGGLF